MIKKDDKVLRSGLSRTVYPIGEQRATVLNTPSKEALALPFYWTLPADPVECLKWKVYCRERCLVDLEFRANIMYMCEKDVAFFTETFGTFFEPRPPRPMPIKLWTDQVDFLAWMEECYGERDFGLEKSRGIGVSCLCAAFYYHKFFFSKNAKIGFVSKDETALDGDENSLLGKVVYFHERMPAWARLDKRGRDIMHRNRTDHVLTNLSTSATIQCFVPTNDKVRSSRFTALFFDEFAFLPNNVQAIMNSSVHTTPNRVFVSTWNGTGNDFHIMMRVVASTMLRAEMYWWNNSERWQGCYQYDKGRLVLIDKDYKHPPDYPFEDDGLIRSPWVDFELRRAGSSVQSALEELYGLRGGEGRKLFESAVVAIAETTVKLPSMEGELEETPDGQVVFRPERGGTIKIWGDLGDGREGPFAAGCDLSFGRGATNSTLEIVDLTTGEQVLEIAVNDVAPTPFAQLVSKVLRWLNGKHGDGHTYLTFENNGDQGTMFGEEMLRLGYSNMMRSRYKGVLNADTEATYFGMRNKDGGSLILGEFGRAVLDGECTVRSEDLYKEMEQFDRDEKGRPSIPKTELGHGDRTQGFAMAWFLARKKLIDKPLEKREEGRREMEEWQPESQSWGSAWSVGHLAGRL